VVDAVKRELTIAGPASAVWEALTDPEQLASWFGADVEIDLRAGGAVRFRWRDGTERRGLVEEMDPPHRLVFRWRTLRVSDGSLAAGEASTVAFELRPTAGGTRLVLTETPGLFAEVGT
jgi:uncharacterized protein YndB with AHSA1/START domain